jgi:hypothetical protein
VVFLFNRDLQMVVQLIDTPAFARPHEEYDSEKRREKRIVLSMKEQVVLMEGIDGLTGCF